MKVRMQTALYLVLIALAPIVSGADLFDPFGILDGDIFKQLGDLDNFDYKRNLFRKDDEFTVPVARTNLLRIVGAEICAERPVCPKSAAFRTIDGVCNNQIFTEWGQAGTAQTRLAQAAYADGVHRPRKAKSGRELPNAREIVVRAFKTIERMDKIDTLSVMSIGQLVTHDTTKADIPLIPPEECCLRDNAYASGRCMNIAVSPNDPFYRHYNVTCLPFVRARATGSIGCKIIPEYVLNEVSHFVDASFVYGSKPKQAAALRTRSGGKLKQFRIRGRSYPPLNTKRSVCPFRRRGDYCMKAGDTRANQNTPLAALQVVFFREHNRLATELRRLNPRWNDERLYQEARRILIAKWQIIVYRDYLPAVIGIHAAKEQKLLPDLEHLRGEYSVLKHPGTTVDFANAAFRIYHSQIPDTFCSRGGSERASGCPFGADKFSNSFNDPRILGIRGGLESVLAGLPEHSAALVDDAYSIEVAGKLFPKKRGRQFGDDLIATDIQRSRDVGLPPYNAYRDLCGLRTAHTWEQLLATGDFHERDVEALASIYESPEDLDVYVAGVLEKKFDGAALGRTFVCLVVDQFKRWKEGDNFFVDRKGKAYSFTPGQAEALASTSIARILCDNGDGIREIRRNIFSLKSDHVSCDELPRVDLSPWKDRPTPAETKKVVASIAQKIGNAIF